LDLVGLDEMRARPIRQLSKGSVQRVGLAQALLNDPELVVLDEPMSGLDPMGRRDVREIILRLGREGRTVLFSSHILSDAELLCGRVAILANGRVVAGGTVADLTRGTAVRRGRGWEVAAQDVSPLAADRLAFRGLRATRIADGRYVFDVPAVERPEPVVAALAAAGARLMSVTAVGGSLEDVFVAAVSGAAPVQWNGSSVGLLEAVGS
jgi:ABC-2 type transport system ATP-binding protein